MINKETEIPKILTNHPLGEDLFEGGSQRTIAQSIVKILQDGTYKMIGIDGGWGTGKSNLIKLVDKLINGNNEIEKKENKKKHHFFIYDSWGHQEDEQRRSILEELTEYLIDKKVCGFSSKIWKNKRKQLLSKKKTTTIKNNPKIGMGYHLSIIVLLLTPVFGIISSSLKGDDKVLLKIGIVSIPLCFFIICYLYCVLKEFVKKLKYKNNYEGCWLKNACYEMFYITKKESREIENFEVIVEEQPSVRNFRDWIKEIDKDLVNNNNKLCIVLDNMDRLPRIKIQELWSSIHTFFAEDNDCKNVSVIVPFDRDHIKAAFKEEDTLNSKDDKTRKCFGNDFINKTFNIVFRVSLPIMSDWKLFFRQKWNEAFGIGSSENINDIIQIYEALTERITPREIIAFINEFVTIKLSNYAKIEDKYIALFIKGKDVILANPIKEIIHPSYLGESLSRIYINGEDLQTNIAAITYQIKAENALSIVYTDVLKKALNEKNIERVSLISESPKFYDIISSIICELSNIVNAIEVLRDIPNEAYDGESNYDKIWFDIYSQAKLEYETKPNIQEYQKIIFENIKSTKREKWLNHIINIYIQADPFNATTYCANLEEIENQITTGNYGINLSLLLKEKETSPNDFVDCLNEKDSNLDKYKIRCNNEDDLDRLLSELSIEMLDSYNFIPKLFDLYPLNKYKGHIKALIGDNTVQSNLEQLKIVIKRNKEIEKRISTEIPDANIYTHFISINTDNDLFYDLLAMRIAKFNTFNVSYVSYFVTHLNSNDGVTIEKIAERIEFYTSFGDLLLNLSAFTQFPLYRGIVKNLILENSEGIKENISDLLKQFITIRELCEVSSRELINKLNVCADFLEIDNSNIEDAIPYELLKETKDEDLEIVRKYNDKVIDYLQSLTLEDWEKAFENLESYEVKTALLLDYKWNTNSKDGLTNLLKKIARKEIGIPAKEGWNEFIAKLEKQEIILKPIFKDIRDVLCGGADHLSKEMFLFFGEWLFKYSNLEEKTDSLRKIFPSNIIKDDDILEVIINNKEKMSLIIEKEDDDNANNFKEAIREYAEEEKGRAIELAQYLKINIERMEEEEEEKGEKEELS